MTTVVSHHCFHPEPQYAGCSSGGAPRHSSPHPHRRLRPKDCHLGNSKASGQVARADKVTRRHQGLGGALPLPSAYSPQPWNLCIQGAIRPWSQEVEYRGPPAAPTQRGLLPGLPLLPGRQEGHLGGAGRPLELGERPSEAQGRKRPLGRLQMPHMVTRRGMGGSPSPTR